MKTQIYHFFNYLIFLNSTILLAPAPFVSYKLSGEHFSRICDLNSALQECVKKDSRFVDGCFFKDQELLNSLDQDFRDHLQNLKKDHDFVEELIESLSKLLVSKMFLTTEPFLRFFFIDSKDSAAEESLLLFKAVCDCVFLFNNALIRLLISLVDQLNFNISKHTDLFLSLHLFEDKWGNLALLVKVSTSENSVYDCSKGCYFKLLLTKTLRGDRDSFVSKSSYVGFTLIKDYLDAFASAARIGSSVALQLELTKNCSFNMHHTKSLISPQNKNVSSRKKVDPEADFSTLQSATDDFVSQVLSVFSLAINKNCSHCCKSINEQRSEVLVDASAVKERQKRVVVSNDSEPKSNHKKLESIKEALDQYEKDLVARAAKQVEEDKKAAEIEAQERLKRSELRKQVKQESPKKPSWNDTRKRPGV